MKDTFDGGFDTEEKFDLTAHTVGNFDAWIVDECDFLSRVRWSRLVSVAPENRHVFRLLAGNPGQFRPRIDDEGVTARRYYCDLITLKEQLRFVADSPVGNCVGTSIGITS